MAGAFDVGVLKGIRPTSELAGAALRDGLEIRNLGFEIEKRRAAFEEAEHGADFSGGTAGDVEECDELVGGAALEAFGDVVGDGEGATVELVALGIGDVGFCGDEEVLAKLGKADCLIPNGQVFETFVFHRI